MALLTPPRVHAAALHWDGQDRMYTAEASELPPFGPVFDDATDEGLTLVSQYPGRPDVVFVVSGTETDPDDDIAWWDLTPARPQDAARLRVTIRVFND